MASIRLLSRVKRRQDDTPGGSTKLPPWIEPIHADDCVQAFDSVATVFTRWVASEGRPFLVMDVGGHVRGVVTLGDVLAYMARQSQSIHHLWPAHTVILPELSVEDLLIQILPMPIRQFCRRGTRPSRCPRDPGHAARMLEYTRQSLMFVVDGQGAVGKITGLSLARAVGLMAMDTSCKFEG